MLVLWSDPNQLVQQLSAGSAEAASALVQRYGPVIERVIWRHLSACLRGLLDPCDLAQEVWTAFFKQKLYLEAPPTALGRFLKGMARNKALAANRDQARQKRDRGREVALDSTAVNPDRDLCDGKAGPVEAAALWEEWEILCAALSERDREVLELLRQGYDAEEVARVRGISVSTVRRAEARAREVTRRLKLG
jgi:RNA polymerase sigma factor (sigma-70 family)